jgi:hypothetical protein
MKFVHIVLSLLMLSLMALPGPAAATDKAQAIKLCEKAQNCTVFEYKGNISLNGTNSQGNYEIYCPGNGPCTCVSCPGPARLIGDAGIRAFIVGIPPLAEASMHGTPHQTQSPPVPAPTPIEVEIED